MGDTEELMLTVKASELQEGDLLRGGLLDRWGVSRIAPPTLGAPQKVSIGIRAHALNTAPTAILYLEADQQVDIYRTEQKSWTQQLDEARDRLDVVMSKIKYGDPEVGLSDVVEPMMRMVSLVADWVRKHA